MNYQQLKEFYDGGTKRSKEIGRTIKNNTRVIKTERGYGVKYHRTTIIDVCPNDTYLIDTDGYHTRSTKDRVNLFAPIEVYQKQFVWYFRGSVFEDGMVFTSQGSLIV